MPNTEQVIVACASCGTQYNVASMAPGAKFKCQKCSTINIVPALEEPVQEEAPPPPPPRPQPRPPVKTNARPAPAPSRISGSRVPTSRASAPLKKGKIPSRTTEEGEEVEMDTKKGGILAKENRKYLYIGGAVLMVILGMFYVVHSNSVYKRNKQMAEDATKAIKEINGLIGNKEYAKAMEKSEAFVREFKESEIPEVKKNVENTATSIRGLEKLIELEKEGKAKLADLIDKKNNASPDQYENLSKEFSKFMSKYSELSNLVNKAYDELKDIDVKIAAQQEEDDTKVYNELMAEIKPMVDGGRIDGAIAHLKKYWDETPKISKRLQGALKKKLTELKEMK